VTAVHRVDAVIFDLDGVLVDSEAIWDEARRVVVHRNGGTWTAQATRDMMGMSSAEWSEYLRDRLGVALPADTIASEVAAIVDQRYQEHLPLLPGAREAVQRLAAAWPLGLASSSNRTIIERFLDASGLRESFAVTVSSEEVAHGKPAPDVYLAVLARMHVAAPRAIAVEDSTNGIASAANAGLTVIAVPNKQFPPSDAAVARAAVVLDDLDGLTVERVEAAAVAG
jgi:HAD superfamily hydrolase (TIGR01509 family)